MSRIDDGHPTTITIGGAGSTLSAYLWEKSVTPPGISGGGEIDTTTMHNSIWRTRAPKSLKTLTNSTLTIAYDPALYDALVSLINVNVEMVITFPDSSTLTFWGWIDEWSPGECVEGAQATADITIICSNENDANVETAPVYSA